MTGTAAPRRRPRIRMTVQARDGRYRTAADLSNPSAGDRAIPTVANGEYVRVGVGAGLGPADVATAVALARSVQNAGTVEIVGRTAKAADAARRLFIAAWSLDPDRDTSVPLEASTGTAWVSLLLAMAGYREDDLER